MMLSIIAFITSEKPSVIILFKYSLCYIYLSYSISPEMKENESLISKVIFSGTRAQLESHLWLQSLLLPLGFPLDLLRACMHACMHALHSVVSDSL